MLGHKLSRRHLTMRPLIVELGRDYRGGQHQALLLLQGLLSRGHTPELIAVRDSLLADRAEDAGISVSGIGSGDRRVSAALQIRRLHGEHVDGQLVAVVHANEPHALTAAWLARAHRSVPVIASRRVVYPLSSSSISLARYRAATRVVAVSHVVEESVIKSGLLASKIDVIYDGVKIPRRVTAADRDSARDKLRIPRTSICVGNIAAYVPGKGHEVLVRAFAELKQQLPEYLLLLRGEGPDLPEIQELARQLQVLDAVKFFAPVTEIETMFAAMNIFAFPVSAEALGSVLLAAMAHGLPVVASACGGIPEVVENEKNGLLVRHLDPNNLLAAMMRLIANPEEARLFGSNARETITARFSVDRMVDDTLRLYEQLIAAET